MGQNTYHQDNNFITFPYSLPLLNITRGPVGLNHLNPAHIGFFGQCSTWGAFHLHPVTHLSLKSDDLNFVQNYFGVGLIFCGKKNWDQIDNDVTMTSSFL